MGLIADGFIVLASFLFGKVSSANEALIRIGIFAILFIMFARGAKKAIPENASAANIVSFIIAAIAVRLMPLVWLNPLGKFLWAFLLIAVPFMVVDAFFKEWTFTKLGFLIGSYLLVFVLVKSTGYWGFGSTINVFNTLRDYWHYYRWQMIVAFSLLIAYVSMGFARRMKQK